MDGHYSHVNNLELILRAKEESQDGKIIRMVCFPAGLTHILQPLDVSVFGGVKKKWADYLRDFSFKPWLNVSTAFFFKK